MSREPNMGELKAIIEAYNKAITEAPYATMKDGPDKYLFRKDNKQKLVGSYLGDEEAYKKGELDICPRCDGSGKEDVDEFCGLCNKYSDEEELEENMMDKELRDMQIAAGIRVAEDCDVDVENNADGECSPFTHADDNVAMVREDDYEDDFEPATNICPACEGTGNQYGSGGGGDCEQCDGVGEVFEDQTREDLLLPPKGDVGRKGEGRGWDDGVDTADYANSFADDDDRISDEDDEGTYSGKTNFDDETFDDWTAKYPGESVEEAGPGDDEDEFSYDDDAMVDLGDDDEYDFNDEFEREIGNTNRFESVVDMNELRKLAGLALVETEATDEEELEEAELSDPSKNTHVGREFASSEFEEDKFDDNFDGLASGEIVAYEIADEKAYYAMADILGAELDFGPQDEVLVPAARNDALVLELRGLGFEQGKHFEVAGQLQDDLQNGYDDHTYTDGQDYFPKGATSTPATDLGPTASNMRDNPMANKMRSVEKDDVYESMKLAYRRFRKV